MARLVGTEGQARSWTQLPTVSAHVCGGARRYRAEPQSADCALLQSWQRLDAQGHAVGLSKCLYLTIKGPLKVPLKRELRCWPAARESTTLVGRRKVTFLASPVSLSVDSTVCLSMPKRNLTGNERNVCLFRNGIYHQRSIIFVSGLFLV